MDKAALISNPVLPIQGVSGIKEKACVEFLEEAGYTIIAPYTKPTAIKSLPALIDLFYRRMDECFPDRKLRPKGFKSGDRKNMSVFLNNLNECTSRAKRKPYAEAVDIINTLFDNYSQLGLTSLDSVVVLLNKRVINDVIQIINGEKDALQLQLEAEIDALLDSRPLSKREDRLVRDSLLAAHDKVCKNDKKE